MRRRTGEWDGEMSLQSRFLGYRKGESGETDDKTGTDFWKFLSYCIMFCHIRLKGCTIRGRIHNRYIQFAIYEPIMIMSANMQSTNNAIYCKLHESGKRGSNYVL